MNILGNKMTYTLLPDPKKHTCWDSDDWDGCMVEPGACEGCDEAAQHQCRYCGYGAVFTTHSDWAHADNGDPEVPDRPAKEWYDSPHIY